MLGESGEFDWGAWGTIRLIGREARGVGRRQEAQLCEVQV